MIVLYLEVIDLDGAFEQLVLDLFHDDIFTVDQDENVPRPELHRIRPTLHGTIEGMAGRSDDLLALHPNVDQLIRFIDIGLNNLFQPSHLIP